MSNLEKEIQEFEEFQQDFQAENFVECLQKLCEEVDKLKKKARICLN